MTLKRSRLAFVLVIAFVVMMPGTAAADGVNWEAIAKCESGGNWSANTGNGDYGGLQISEATWRANGGIGTAAQASPEQQVQVAKRILVTQGPDAWPHCMSASRQVAPAGSLSDLLAALWDDAGGYPGPGEG